MTCCAHTVELRTRIRQGLHAANLAHADTRPCDECDECLQVAHTAAVEAAPLLANRDRQIAELTATVQRLRTAILEVIDGDPDPGKYPGDDLVIAALKSDWDTALAETSRLVGERDAAIAAPERRSRRAPKRHHPGVAAAGPPGDRSRHPTEIT